MSQYYRYYGSLTTPPCSRVVVWTLYEVPIYISWSQVRLLSSSDVSHGKTPHTCFDVPPPLFSPQLAQFTSQIFSTEKDAEQEKPLQNNFRHVHPTYSRVVSASRDSKLLTGSGGAQLGSAGSACLLHVVTLGMFICGL